MKKAFTLSETMITLAIIGVLSAILIPLINNVSPDNNRILYKKAMYTLQNAISSALNEVTVATDSEGNPTTSASNSSSFWSDPGIKEDGFCTDISKSLNIVGSANCGVSGSATEPNFTTVNGSKWWGLGNFKFADTTTPKTIYVDVDGNSGENTDGVDRLKMNVTFDGKVSTDPTWTTENDYLTDSLKINK